MNSLINDRSSFGRVGYNLVLAMTKLGHKVKTVAWPESNFDIVETLPKPDFASPDLWVRLSHPDGPVSHPDCEHAGLLTVFESTGLYKHTKIGNLKPLDFIATPSEWCSNILRNIKKDIPIFTWNHGYNPILPFKTNINDQVTTLLTVGCMDDRKHIYNFLKLFEDNFRNSNEIKLIVKSQKGFNPRYCLDCKNVKFVDKELNKLELEKLYLSASAYVMPSRGEAFGLTALEAAMMGIPIMVTNFSGPVDYLDDCASIKLDYDLVDTPNSGPWAGKWAKPTDDAILTGIEELVTNNKLGIKAVDVAQNVRDKWSWEITTERFLNSIQ